MRLTYGVSSMLNPVISANRKSPFTIGVWYEVYSLSGRRLHQTDDVVVRVADCCNELPAANVTDWPLDRAAGRGHRRDCRLNIRHLQVGQRRGAAVAVAVRVE